MVGKKLAETFELIHYVSKCQQLLIVFTYALLAACHVSVYFVLRIISLWTNYAK